MLLSKLTHCYNETLQYVISSTEIENQWFMRGMFTEINHNLETEYNSSI